MRHLLALCIALPLMAWMLAQCRRPMGPIGRAYLWAMNRTHASLTDWALAQVPVGKGDAILDVGCGGGRTVQKLAALAPQGTVSGIDYSKASVAASCRTNGEGIAAGRVRIALGSVAAMPFPDRSFDLVTAVETHYYWPDLPRSLREVFRVVKPGGRLAVIAEVHRKGRFRRRARGDGPAPRRLPDPGRAPAAPGAGGIHRGGDPPAAGDGLDLRPRAPAGVSLAIADLAGAAAVGIGATLLMDLWNLVLKCLFGIPSLDYGLLGRWVLHLPQGTFRHRSMAATPRKSGERAVGWIAHYTIGIALALGFVALLSGDWLARPRLGPAVLYGLVTVVFPLFVLQPSLGLGIASSRTPHPAKARLKSLGTHAVFGVGLYLSALAVSLLRAQP